MKRIALAALAVITLLGLTGCDVFGSTSTDTATPTQSLSKWWIKGSFDGWKGVDDQNAIKSTDTIHYLAIDSLNPNLLTYEITDLKKFTYEFVVMNDAAAGSRVNFQAPSSSAYVDSTSYTLVAKDTGTKNANFVATASSYTVQVDITAPAAPKVKLIPGSTAAVNFTAAELAAGMKVAGGKLSMGWTETAGTFDAATKTVTWTDVGVTDKSSPVYFHGDTGYFKAAADVASPTTVGASSILAPLSGSNDFYLTGVPFSDAKYKFEVIIDPTATTYAQAFTFKATLTAGSAAWSAYSPWTSVYLVGAGSEFGSWTPTAAIAMTGSGGVFTKQITATGTAAAFQILPTNIDWTNQVGAGGIVIGAGSLSSSTSGDIAFTAVVGDTYTITVDFTAANFATDGKPTVKVVTP